MATLHINDVSSQVVYAYIHASQQEQKKIKHTIEETILFWTQTYHLSCQSKRRLLQEGFSQPFKTFKAIDLIEKSTL
ncbi:hypothetical protein BGP_5713 [Beggiatoa sp. PS]|nr:hypothetical protein BGP_5713 [Beggiatoa sp. PS]